MADDPTQRLPALGEHSRAQTLAGTGMIGSMPGYSAVQPGTYETYRKMLRNPTIQLARTVTRAPIEAGSWSFEAKQNAPPGAVEFIRHLYESARPMIVEEMLRALDYGWQPFEKVFSVKPWAPPEGGTPRPLLHVKHKPLLHDITEILSNQENGRFEGFKQGKVEIGLPNALLWSYDAEGDNHYGRARLENVRESWSWWHDCNKGAHKYDQKIAGVFPHVQFPPGKGRDASGAERDNFDIAVKIATAIQAGQPIVTPKLVSKDADDEDLTDPKKQAWVISLLEDRGSRQPGFIERLRYLDSMMFRGFLRPERVALEGQHGTLAESEAHADIAILDGELIHAKIVRTVNWHSVDQVLALNYGEAARGSVWIKPAPLQDTKIVMYRELFKALMAHPSGFGLVLEWLDWDAMVDALGLPKASDIVGLMVERQTKLNGNGDDDAAEARRVVEGTLTDPNTPDDEKRRLMDGIGKAVANAR